MEKKILIAILGLFLGLANMSIAQQVNSNYKQQFPLNKEKSESTVIYTYAHDSYRAANNYKQPAILDKDVRLVSSKPASLPSCCADVQVSANTDYKHPFSQNERRTCDLGYVCKKEVKGSCCN